MYGVTAKTQKAKGVQYLHVTRGSHRMEVPQFKLVQTAAEVALAYSHLQSYGYTSLFARPCPIRPRHGFVDSQAVKSAAQALEVFEKAQAVDPDAEMLLMPRIDAFQSAVLTPTAVSVGFGHDGVTGTGKGVVTLPIAMLDTAWISPEVITDTPYMESVKARYYSPVIVQLRDGPASQGTGDASGYIPADMTVKAVMTARGDLLEWETAVKGASDGTAVHLPGGSMLSHYAVHAVLRGLPVVFTADAPEVGSHLKANVTAAPVDYATIARGMSYGIGRHLSQDDYSDAILAAVFATHHVAAMEKTTDGQLAIGTAVGYLMRSATAALLGEMRHKVIALSKERDVVYKKAMNKYPDARKQLREAWHVFYNGSWTSGFGGKKWAGIAMAAIALDGAALAFFKRPQARQYRTMVANLHTLLNAIHNNGPWIGKFMSDTDILSYMAAGNVAAVLKGAYAAQGFILEAREWREVSPWAARALKVPKLPMQPVDFQVVWTNGTKVSLWAKKQHEEWERAADIKLSQEDRDRTSRLCRACGQGSYGALVGMVEIPMLPRKLRNKIASIQKGVANGQI